MDNNKQELNPLIFKIGQRIQKYRLQINFITKEENAYMMYQEMEKLDQINYLVYL